MAKLVFPGVLAMSLFMVLPFEAIAGDGDDAPAVPASRRLWKTVQVRHGYGDAEAKGRQAFHFAIADGEDAPDGAIITGWRWREQFDGSWGDDEDLNAYAVSILMLDLRPAEPAPPPVEGAEPVAAPPRKPTEAQLASLAKLLGWLADEHGLDPSNPFVEPADGPYEGAWAAKVRRGWRYIVIHHSATAVGGAASFGKWHEQKGWGGLGYHFVIGNGTESGDGELEVGFRWKDQTDGAHAASRRFNQEGIGICLVGNLSEKPATEAQVQTLRRIVAALQKEYGIADDRILGHKDVRDGLTECPGKHGQLGELLGK